MYICKAKVESSSSTDKVQLFCSRQAHRVTDPKVKATLRMRRGKTELYKENYGWRWSRAAAVVEVAKKYNIDDL